MPTSKTVIDAIVSDFIITQKNFDNYNYVLNLIKKHGGTKQNQKTSNS